MATNYRMIEFNGKSMTVGQWSKETGLHHGTITNRLDQGWSAERTLTEKPDARYTTAKCKISKNEAEMTLNDTPYEQLPKCLTDLIPRTKRPVIAMGRAEAKYGQVFRRNHAAAFQRWFNETYC